MYSFEFKKCLEMMQKFVSYGRLSGGVCFVGWSECVPHYTIEPTETLEGEKSNLGNRTKYSSVRSARILTRIPNEWEETQDKRR